MKNKTLGILFFVLVIVTSWHFTANAASPHVIINEIQLAGASSTDEFVELYNPSNEAVNLSGWRLSKRTSSGTQSNLLTTFPDVLLAPGGVFLVAHPTGYTGSAPAQATYSTQSSLAKDNTVILYQDAGKTILDLVGLGAASTSEGTSAPNPDDGQSITRKNVTSGLLDSDNNAADFIISSPSPGTATTPTPIEPPPSDNPETPTQPPAPPPTGGGGGSMSTIAADIRINEFVPDPTSDDTEWIELVNLSGTSVRLDGWTITDGSKAVTTLTGTIGTGDNRFFVVISPAGQLNNAGDSMTLSDNVGNQIDSVSYGNWDDGNTRDNAPTAPDPSSVARTNEDVSTGNDANDFVIATQPTKGKANAVKTASKETSPPAAKTHVRITEILPNPLGSDDNEFIELYNTGDIEVSLLGWVIADDETTFTITSKPGSITVLLPHTYTLLRRTQTNIALNNFSGDTVTLTAPKSTRPLQTVRYTGLPQVGKSYANTGSAWKWGDPTPEKAAPLPPAPSSIRLHSNVPSTHKVGDTVVLSAEDSVDVKNGTLRFHWDLGDGSTASGPLVLYVYYKPGTYTITVTATNTEKESAREEKQITIIDPTGKVLGQATAVEGVRINEILPRPSSGPEWIELANITKTRLSLLGWSMSDASTRRYNFTEADSIAPLGFLVIEKTVSKLALNNDGDTLTLTTPDGNDIDELTYEKAPAGASYARDEDGEWVWLETPTPASENTGAPRTTLTIGAAGTIAGTVTAAPGTISPAFFYLGRIAATGMPENLRVDIGSVTAEITGGDIVQITGTLKKVAGEHRFVATNIEHIGRDDTAVAPVPLDALVPSEHLGRLVSVLGTVGKGTTGGFYITMANDETTRVILPAETADRQPFPKGTEINAIGILSQTSAGLRILARGMEDLTITAEQIMVEPAPTEIQAVKTKQYTAVSVLGAIALVGAIAWRVRRRNDALPFIIDDVGRG